MQICYYPEKDYIPYESIFRRSSIDFYPGMKLTDTTVDVKDTTKLWVFIIQNKDLNYKFFNDVHNIDQNYIVLPHNVISSTYFDGLDEKKNLSFP